MSEQDVVRREFYAKHEAWKLMGLNIDPITIDDMVKEIIRLRRIIAVLREPSEGVLIAVHQQLKGIAPRVAVIRAAVAAAEKEAEV